MLDVRIRNSAGTNGFLVDECELWRSEKTKRLG